MLKFNNYPPEEAGDAELADGVKRDLEVGNSFGGHRLFGRVSTESITLLGITAGYSITEPRVAAAESEASPESTVEIAKPVVDQVGEITDNAKAISFARGVFFSLRISFPDFHEESFRDSTREHYLFQELISGVCEEAAEQIEARASK